MGGWVDGWIALGFGTSWSQSTEALINGPFVPHIKSWEACNFTEVPDGPQAYALNILRLQEKEPRYACLSEAKASHSQRMWAEVSSLIPHLLHNGLYSSPRK